MPPKPPAKPVAKPEMTVVAGRKLTKGQLAYESERAAPPKPAKKPGLISRLLDKAHKPLG
jgi:hypothetical protein